LGFSGFAAPFGDGGLGHKSAFAVNGLGGLEWLAAYRFRGASANSVIASEAKQTIAPQAENWIASSLPPSLFELRRTSHSSQ
jgi:hypothetical protein